MNITTIANKFVSHSIKFSLTDPELRDFSWVTNIQEILIKKYYKNMNYADIWELFFIYKKDGVYTNYISYSNTNDLYNDLKLIKLLIFLHNIKIKFKD